MRVNSASLQQLRFCSVSSNSFEITKPTVFRTECVDPFVNLATEEWIFKQGYVNALFLWHNAPVVVIGRNQNPWVECNLAALKAHDVRFARRRSGGGTVYHDLGNANYTLFTTRDSFSKRKNLEFLVEVLRNLNIPAAISPRHDICVDNHKISGSAFKIAGNGAYHHGTMLINSNLHQLESALLSNAASITAKGVASKRSKVMNLRDINPHLSVPSFFDALGQGFAAIAGNGDCEFVNISPDFLENNDFITATSKELQSWEWAYGQTPEFVQMITGDLPLGSLSLTLTIDDAVIRAANLEGSLEYLAELREHVQRLPGLRYCPGRLKERLREWLNESDLKDPALADIHRWVDRGFQM